MLDIKQKKINNLFNIETKKAVMIPMDHGMLKGMIEGLEDPVECVKRFTKLGADALLLNYGALKMNADYLHGLKKSIGIIMTVDYNLMWQSWKAPIDGDVILGHCNYASVELAVKYGADAVKVLFPLGLEPEITLDYYKDIAEIIKEADKHDMPVMIEPLTLGKYIPKDKKYDANIIANGCRIAVELGADIIKTPFPGYDGREVFAEICSNLHVPIVILGGPKKGSLKSIMDTARLGIDAGAKGVIFGRNVWQRPVEEMNRTVRALQDIVHKGVSMDEIMVKYNL